MEEPVIQQRTNKIFSFLKGNWILLSIILIALIIRMFFFYNTAMSGQASWWDSAEYLSIGQHYATGLPYMVSEIRPPLYQYMVAGLISIGANEQWIILLLTLIPSVLLIWFIYLLVKEMLGKNAGLIASGFAAISWNFIFWSNRAQPDFISLCLQVLAIYYFWKIFNVKDGELDTDKITAKKQRIRFAMFAAGYAALGFYFKISALLIPLALALFVLIKDRLGAFTKKEYWIYLITYVTCFIPYCTWAYFSFGNILPFVAPYSTNAGTSMPLGWGVLAFFNVFGLNLMFWIFLIGIILCLKVLLYSDIIIKDKIKAFDYRIFILTLICIVLAFYIFYIKAVEDRWVFILLPIMALLCSSVLVKIYDWLSEKNLKWLAIIIILALMMGTAYEQVTYAGKVIDNKKGTYSQVKEAAEWIKANSQPSEIIMSISYPQTVYYSQRHVETYSRMNVTTFEKYLSDNHPTYLIISLLEPNHPEFIWTWASNSSRAIPVNAWFADPITKKQPLLIIYRFIY